MQRLQDTQAGKARKACPRRLMSDGPIKAIIVGAGPAGLTAAYELAKAGQRVLVLESDPDYGE